MREGLFLACRGIKVEWAERSRDTYPTQSSAADWETRLARRPTQTLCVLGNHRVWCSQCREGPCGRNQRAGACPSAGARYSSSSPLVLLILLPLRYSVCFNMSKPNRSLWGIHSASSSFHFLFFPLLSFSLSFLFDGPNPPPSSCKSFMPHNSPQRTTLWENSRCRFTLFRLAEERGFDCVSICKINTLEEVLWHLGIEDV